MKNIAFKILFSVVLVLFINSAYAIFLDVKIFTGLNSKGAIITPISGKYSLYGNDQKIAELYKNASVTIKIISGKVNINKAGDDLGSFLNVRLEGEGFLNAFRIKPIEQGMPERIYDDHLKLSVNEGFLRIINKVDLERYVAGVVQSEGGGSSKDIEFFLVQAITTRTYALTNYKKHSKEGYNLCDDIHCQVYGSRCRNSDITTAVNRTLGEVIIDINGRMISAAFHANSGGQTANSEDVWTIETPYLKSRVDSMSIEAKNAFWEKKIPKDDFTNYLKKAHNFDVKDHVKMDSIFNFTQEYRKIYLIDSIMLKHIRRDLFLRSTFFSIKDQGDTLVLNGKGYGHGVGLSQDGAIRMATLGYTYQEIIKYYYTDVEIVNIMDLKYLLKGFGQTGN